MTRKKWNEDYEVNMDNDLELHSNFNDYLRAENKALRSKIMNANLTDYDKLQRLNEVEGLERLQEVTENHCNSMDKAQALINKTNASICRDKFRSIRKKQKNKKRVTSVAIHDDNQSLISELQEEARKRSFVLSKEFIINMALRSFGRKYYERSFIEVMCEDIWNL